MYKEYLTLWDQMSISEGCIIKDNYQVVVPNAITRKVMNELHSDHWGIVKTKALARTYVWWPNINKDIELLIKKCSKCASFQKNPPSERTHKWNEPQKPWKRLHIDFAGVFLKKYYLIVFLFNSPCIFYLLYY